MMTQRLAGLHHRLQQRQQLLQSGQLLFVDQDIRIFHLDPHLVGVGDEVGRDVAAVELHALDHFELGFERLCFLDRDHALVADLLHGIGNETTDLGVAVGRDGADLGDLLVRGDVLGVLLQVRDDGLDREVDAAFEIHRVHAGSNSLGAFPDDRVSEHGRGGGAVTGLVGGLRGDLAHHLRAHVLELVFELDLLGDGHAVLGDAGSAERLVEHDVAALGAERHAHRVGESIDAAQHSVARVDREFDFLGRHLRIPFVAPHLEDDCWRVRTMRISIRCSRLEAAFCRLRTRLRAGSGGLLLGLGLIEHAHDVALLHDQVLDAIDLDLGARPFAEQHAVADLEVDRDELAALVAAARADAR